MKNRIQMFKAMLVLTFILASAASAHAYDFSAVCNTGQTLYYNILSDSTVAVTYPNYSNESYYYGFIKPSGTLQIPATVSHGGSSYRVISLGNNAFYSCTGLMAVSIPSSISIIGDGTFYNCTGFLYLHGPYGCLHPLFCLNHWRRHLLQLYRPLIHCHPR